MDSYFIQCNKKHVFCVYVCVCVCVCVNIHTIMELKLFSLASENHSLYRTDFNVLMICLLNSLSSAKQLA